MYHTAEKMKHSVIQLRREFVPSIGMSKDNGFFCNHVRACYQWTREDEGKLLFLQEAVGVAVSLAGKCTVNDRLGLRQQVQ